MSGPRGVLAKDRFRLLATAAVTALLAARYCPVSGQDEEPFFDLEGPRVISENLSGRGTLDFEDPYPLAGLHLELPTNPFVMLEQGDIELTTALMWANSFGLSSAEDIEVDAEVFRFRLGGWYALTDTVYLGARLPLVVRGSGTLDSTIDGFHETFGLSDGNRGERPRNRYEVRVTEDGETERLESQGGFGNLVLSTHWNVHPGAGSYPGVSLQAHASLPTGEDGLSSDGIDFGMNVAVSKEILPQTYLHLVAGGTMRGDARTEGLRYERYSYQLIAGVEWAVLEELSLVVQGMSLSPLLEERGFLADTRGYAGLGAKWEFTPGIELELGFIENLQPFKNSADVAFNAAFTFRL